MLLRLARIIVETLMWAIVAVVLLGIGAVIIGLSSSMPLGAVIPVLLLLLLPLVAKLVQMVRQRRSALTLIYLEQAVRLRMPLPDMLYAAQRSEPGRLSRRLARLRQFLEDGYPISTALRQAVPEVRPRAIALTAAAERTGRLPDVLRRLVEEQKSRQLGDVSTIVFYRAYPIVMLMVLSLIIMMLMVFVMPKFEDIIRDFGIPMPTITRYTISFARDIGPAALLITAAAVLVMMGRMTWETFRPGGIPAELRLGLLDRLGWYLPIAHGLARDRGLADACEVLADAFDAALPADRAMMEAASLYINPVLRDRFMHCARSVSAGAPLADAARDAGLPKLVSGMLLTARTHEDAADAFRFLARYYRGRFSRVVMLLEGAIVPVVVLIFGVLVAAVALSMFTPIIKMSEAVMESSGLM